MTDIETLVLIDKQIDENESCALRARWEFGREMLAMRDGKGRLPDGKLTELVAATGKNRVELSRRVRFAERYSTEDELCHAVTQLGSWHQVVKNLKAEKDVADNAPVVPLPVIEGEFRTFVADPPWQYGNTAARGAAENHYGTMTIEELCALDVVPNHAAADAHLYMWTTSSHLHEAFDVMAAWGFEYKTYLVWVKPQIGMGNYFRTCTELVLFGVRGSMRTQARDIRNWFEAPRSNHSAKPAVFHELVAKASPGPYLELFARCNGSPDCHCSRCAHGWEIWGNQT